MSIEAIRARLRAAVALQPGYDQEDKQAVKENLEAIDLLLAVAEAALKKRRAHGSPSGCRKCEAIMDAALDALEAAP